MGEGLRRSKGVENDCVRGVAGYDGNESRGDRL
jgi:hypothetical protein